MTSCRKLACMGLFTAFLKVVWVFSITAVAASLIAAGWLKPEPVGTIYIGTGLFVLGLAAITILATAYVRVVTWP